MEVFAEDTDIAVLLLYHWSSSLFDIVLTSDRKKSWSIKECSSILSDDMRSSLLFLHAVSGCDTTSAVFGVGNISTFKLFKG